jgi:glucose/arabinose dehydrogenase
MRRLPLAMAVLAACAMRGSGQSNTGTAAPDGAVATTGDAGTIVSAGLTLPPGFAAEVIATIPNARQMVALPNGDLLVAALDTRIHLVPGAEGTPSPASVYFDIPDAPVHSIAFDAATSTLFAGSQHGVWSAPYALGHPPSQPKKIASVRVGGASGTDGDMHTTTSVAVSGSTLYVSVGSSCNACVESDATRAVILTMNLDGSNVVRKATRIRNAIALATNPATGTVWAGGAGQDSLPLGHPFEFFDAVSLHPGTADYGWPDCEENQHPYRPGANCSQTVAPLLGLPAYSTFISAVFYPANQTGAHAFPAANRGLYLAAHGSWHTTNGRYFSAPRVAFVPMNGDAPAQPADWSDPTAQFSEFIGGYQLSDGTTRNGRPTGLAVGPQGSLFVADDLNGHIYRIRPTR